MKNVLNHTGPIPADEPVFVIRAKDILATKVLTYYADQLRALGVTGGAVTSVKEAAKTMAAYPGEKEVILPIDMPAQPASVREAAAAKDETVATKEPPDTPHGRNRRAAADQ